LSRGEACVVSGHRTRLIKIAKLDAIRIGHVQIVAEVEEVARHKA
jgi:hypothetical protein